MSYSLAPVTELEDAADSSGSGIDVKLKLVPGRQHGASIQINAVTRELLGLPREVMDVLGEREAAYLGRLHRRGNEVRVCQTEHGRWDSQGRHLDRWKRSVGRGGLRTEKAGCKCA